jgi:cell division protein FtsQ
MDGGGRLFEPLTAGSSGGAVAHAGHFAYPGERRTSLFARLPLFGRSRHPRRRSLAAKIDRRLPRFLGTSLAVGFFAAVIGTGLSAGGHLDEMIARNGAPHHALAKLVGLGIDRVTISGLVQLRASEVLGAAYVSPRVSLAFLDAAESRAGLEALPLVKSASVRKLFPNELVIAIVERQPHALWQRGGELSVIAADGEVIDTFDGDPRYAALPLVVGETANKRTQDYLRLLEAAGPLKDRIRAGTLVSDRRWTLKLDNGLDIRLPEIDPQAALGRLVALERDQKLLEKDIIAVDLRMPDRVVVRLTEEAAAARAEAIKKKPTRGKGVDT